MASSKEYHDFIIDSIGLSEDITSKKMMGEYLLYYKDILFGGIYDNRFLIKDTPSARLILKNAAMEIPYQGAKPMFMPDRLEDDVFLSKLIIAVSADLKNKKQSDKISRREV